MQNPTAPVGSPAPVYGSPKAISDGVNLQLDRAPSVFKTVSGSSGTVTLWTPATGKRFRLLRYAIEVTAQVAASSAGSGSITLQDSATGIGIVHNFYAPGTSVTTTPGNAYYTGWVDLGPLGILSAAANNALTAAFAGVTITAGAVRFRVCGTEE